jgi:hypothetical protein
MSTCKHTNGLPGVCGRLPCEAPECFLEEVYHVDKTLCPSTLRKFWMERTDDESGVSGAGVVLEGVVLTGGHVVVHWLSQSPKDAITVFESIDSFLAVHVFSHKTNGTIIRYEDGEVWKQ